MNAGPSPRYHVGAPVTQGRWRRAADVFVAVAGLSAAAAGLALLPVKFILLLVFGSLAIVVLLERPVWGVLALIPIIPFSSVLSVKIGGFQVGAMEGLLATVVVAWLARMASRRQVFVPHAPLLLPWLLWLFLILASWLGTSSLPDAVSETAKWVEMLALYLFFVANVKARHLPWVVGLILATGVAQAGLGLYQAYYGVGPKGFLLLEGSVLRAYGTFRQPNPYAGYLGLVYPLALSLLAHHVSTSGARLSGLGTWLHRRGFVPWASRAWILVLSVSAAATISLLAGGYASRSRGAWLGMATASLLVLGLRSRRAISLSILGSISLAVLLALTGVLGAANLLPSGVTQRFEDVMPVLQVPNIATAEVTDANFPTIERLAHWQAAADMWRDHLWTGVGMGNYPSVYPGYAIGRWQDPLGHAHNVYLNAAAETGLLGLLVFLFFWVAAFCLAVRTVSITAGRNRALAVGIVGVLAFFCVHNFFDNLYVQGMYLQLAITLGVLAVLNQTSDGRNRASITSQRAGDDLIDRQ